MVIPCSTLCRPSVDCLHNLKEEGNSFQELHKKEIDREGGGRVGNVIQWGNFSNQLFYHNFRVLISKIYVIWLFKGAFSLDFNLKPRFRQMVIDFIPELIAGL